MARLIVENIGPLKKVDIDLERVNVFVGPQGAGKSTLAKILSFCTWLEKHRMGDDIFTDAISHLKTYHRLDTFFAPNSKIYYQGYDIIYTFGWKEDAIPVPEGFEVTNTLRSNSQEIILFSVSRSVNPKVIYIPAERNFVSVVPNLQSYQEDADSLQSFVVDWYNAKRKYTQNTPLKVLNLGVRFFSDKSLIDYLELEDGSVIPLSASASGLQSIIPLLILVDWLSNGIYKVDKPFSPIEHEKIRATLEELRSEQSSEDFMQLKKRLMGFIEGKIHSHTQFVIEEPEQNLFPKTQKDLVYHLISSLDHGKNHHLVLTTHSPYILSALNNLLYAHKIAATGKSELVKEVVDASSWLDYKQTRAYYISDGTAKKIMDSTTGMICAETIDAISDTLNKEFEDLLNIEYRP